MTVHQLKLNKSWNNDPKVSSKSDTEWPQTKKIHLSESESRPQPQQQILWNDLKRVCYTKHPKNMSELKKFYEKEWFKMTPEHYAGLVHSYWKHVFKWQRFHNFGHLKDL